LIVPTRAILLLTTAVTATSVAHAAIAPAESPQAGSGSDIVVTGTRQDATALKKNAPVVLDARSTQEIRSLPDINAAEALQRIPGVQMESDSGEGRFINIRGLDADLNAASYDGVRLTASNPASPQGGGRAVAFDAFPSAVLGGIEVVKSLSPDMDAEGLGGTVNILPRTMAPGQTVMVDAGAGVGYEPLRGTPRYIANMTAGVTSRDGRFSLVGSYAYDEDQRSIDDVEADYTNDPNSTPPGTDGYVAAKAYDDIQPRTYHYHRYRQGFAGSLTYRPSDNTSFYIRGLHAGYTEYAHKHEFVISGLGDYSTDANGNVIDRNVTGVAGNGDVSVDGASAKQVVISTKERVSNDVIEGGGRTEFAGGVKLDFRGAYTIGQDAFLHSYYTSFTDPDPLSVTYNNTANPSVPTYRTNDGTDLANPALYTQFSGDNGPTRNTDREVSGVINLAVPVGLGEDGTIKVGGSVRARNRKAYSWSSKFVDPGQGYQSFSGSGDEIFYNGAYNIGPVPFYSKVETIPQTPLTGGLDENDDENVYAGYVQYSGGFGPLSLVGGLRVENTHSTYRTADRSVTRTYTNFFPDLNIKYDVSRDLVVHAAFSTAIGRPGFQQVSASQSIDIPNQLVIAGNPGLKPTTGKSFDLSVEYYTSHGGMISAGAFYKAFSNYIIPTVQRNVTNYPGANGVPVEVDSFQNIGSAHAYGLELDAKQQFVFLPGALSGLGVEGNLTLVQSHGGLHRNPDTGAISYDRLPQTSPLAFNASLFYDRKGFQAKIAGSYVSKNIWAVGGSKAADLYSQPRFRLDASASIDITPQMSFFVEAKNLTNTKLEFTQTGNRNFPVQREFYKADYLAGVRIRLGH
jgi:TonB-dependent receptor